MFLSLEEYKCKNTYSPLKDPAWPTVSILIIVKNELDNLRVLLPLLFNQDYEGAFDIHIVDDHSKDDTRSWLKFIQQNAKVNIYHHVLPGSTSSGKKQGLRYALGIPTQELLLMTDADCRPGTDRWISSMVDALGDEDSIVLGYSPYLFYPTRLNQVIQVETTYTALLYFGLSLKGFAYMGVGRNIVYRKSALAESRNLAVYSNVLSGDDDLTVNELVQKFKINIQFSPESRVNSIPKSSWKDWIKQKSRHVSTARYYQPGHQVLLMLFYSTMIGSWLVILFATLFYPWIALVFLALKYGYYLKFRRVAWITFRQTWTFTSWLLAEAGYILSLIWLSPATFYKKPDQW